MAKSNRWNTFFFFLLLALCLAGFYVSVPIHIRFISSNWNNPKETYLGCFLLGTTYSEKLGDFHLVKTVDECIGTCSSYMFSYFVTLEKLDNTTRGSCFCDDVFDMYGLAPSPSRWNKSADVYLNSNYKIIKYKKISEFAGMECNCTSDRCEKLKCRNKLRRWNLIGPKTLRQSTLCEDDSAKKIWVETKSNYPMESLHSPSCVTNVEGFLPISANWVWPSNGVNNSRIYRLTINSSSELFIPLKASFKQEKVLLLAYMRSGSSFLSETFRQNPKAFFVFEPLIGLTNFEIHKRYPESSKTRELLPPISDVSAGVTQWLDAFYSCDFDRISARTFSRFRQVLQDENSRVCSFQSPHVRFSCLQGLQSECLSKDIISTKVIRSRLRWLLPLFNGNHPDMKVLILVRDPRAVIHSRLKLTDSPVHNYLEVQAKEYCDWMTDDIKAAKKLYTNGNYQVLIVRYEDLTHDISSSASEIYKSLGLGEMSVELKHRLNSLTDKTNSKKSKGAFTTNRANSTQTAMKWKSDIALRLVRLIDAVCQEAYELAGYRAIKTKEDLRDMTSLPILKDFKVLE